jgi:type III pantothenate kinase
MLLAIDVGNTNSKFAVFDGDRLVSQFRLRTEAKRTADEYAAWLTQLMHLQGFDPQSIKGAILASVVPQVNPNIRRLCEIYFETRLLIVGEPDCELGIKVLIDRPQDAGPDRLVGIIAGYKKYGGPLITIDFGSATTFDLADKDGNFVGGVLSPGVELTIESFYLMTARLPRIRVEKPAKVRHLLGLCWLDREPDQAHPRRVRRTHEGHCHGRARQRLQGRDRPVRRDRAGPDVTRPAGDLAPQ